MCPRDQTLGMQATSLSPATTRMVGLTAAEVSFAKTSELLAVLAGVAVETRQVERCAEALGREVAADERAVTEQTAPAPAPTLYLGMDGTGVPVRPAEVEGRRGKQPDGSAKTREVKLATLWTAEGRDPQGRPVRDPGSVSYNAAVESAASRDTDPQPAAFAQRVHREAQRRGFDTADRQVVIGDGAAWIWNVAAEQFPGTIEIVDIYHAKQHLCDVAKALYGAGTDLADQWAKDRRAELDAGRLRALVAALRIHVETTPEARKCIHYVFGNRHRMRYPQFRAKGLCISSGVVEAGCKQIGARLSAPACAGPSPAPTPSSPCAAASSVAASRTSGNDEPQTPPDGHLTILSCTPRRMLLSVRGGPARRARHARGRSGGQRARGRATGERQ